MKVNGGKLTQTTLTTDLQQGNPKEYDIGKAVFWSSLLNQGMKPTTWHKPNKKGTNVSFKTIQDQGMFDEGILELKHYLNLVNEKHGTDLSLNPKEDKQ